MKFRNMLNLTSTNRVFIYENKHSKIAYSNLKCDFFQNIPCVLSSFAVNIIWSAKFSNFVQFSCVTIE